MMAVADNVKSPPNVGEMSCPGKRVQIGLSKAGWH